MPLPPSITAITADDLQRLCDDQERENRFLEYKTDCTFNDASDKIRFLAGVSSFANTDGGGFLIGMPATDGIPTSTQGIPDTDLDARILQLTQVINNGIAPRPQHHIQPIPVSSDRAVILIRVSKSWNAPHRVTFASHDKFYARNSAGKHPMDLDEYGTLSPSRAPSAAAFTTSIRICAATSLSNTSRHTSQQDRSSSSI